MKNLTNQINIMKVQISKVLLLIILAMVLGVSSLKSQNFISVNIDSIKAAIIDEKSDVFYPNLYSRYSANDTTLNPYEYRHLYYGHALQPYFDPRITQSNDSVVALRKYLYLPEIDYNRVIEMTNFVLRLDPFYIDGIYILSSSYYKIGDTARGDLWINKYFKLIKTIWASGDGKSPENAFTVLSISDEYAVLDALGLVFVEQRLLENKGKMYDVLKVEKNELGLDDIYFNIELFHNKLNKPKKD